MIFCLDDKGEDYQNYTVLYCVEPTNAGLTLQSFYDEGHTFGFYLIAHAVTWVARNLEHLEYKLTVLSAVYTPTAVKRQKEITMFY